MFFNLYLSELAKKPIFSPSYYSITEYMQEISGSTVADQITLLFELYEVYREITSSEEPFDDFLFYCEMLLADFDDIDKYLVDASQLFSNLSGLKAMDAYFDYLDEAQINAIRQFWEAFRVSRESEQKKEFTNIWEVLYKIYEKFNTTLENKGIASEGSGYKKAISNLKNNTSNAPGDIICFVGFNALNKCEVELFEIIHKQGRGLFFWDFDPYYTQQIANHEAAYFLKSFILKFPPPSGFYPESNLTSADRTIDIVDITTVSGQAKLIPEIISTLPKGWQENPMKTAITLADETLLMPILNAIPQDVKDVNISMGYPLKETSVYGLIGILLDLQRNKRSGENGLDEYYHADVLKVLLNGILSKIKDQEVLELISEIKRYNLVYVRSNKLKFTVQILSLIFKEGVSASNFVSYLIEILEKLPQVLVDKENQVQLIEEEATFRIITRLTRIGDILGETQIEYSFKSLVRLIGKILQGATIPFSGEPLGGMQIMGILETRTLDFDNIVVLSLNEGVFPKSGHVPSFIPYNLRKAFDLPTIEHQDAIFAYYFYRLLQRTNTVTLVYNSSVQDFKSGEQSRFIQQLIYEKAFRTNAKTIGYRVFPVEKKKIETPKSNETTDLLLNKFSGEKGRLLSPSAVNMYLNCKLRFYYRYIAEIKEPEEVLEEIEANTLGSILHKAIEELYLSPGKSSLLPEDIRTLIKNKKQIEKVVLEAFYTEYLNPGGNNADIENRPLLGRNILVKEVIIKYIDAILNHDLKIAPIDIISLEKEYTKNFVIQDGKTVKVGGIIDRLDRCNGQLRIIDYKTGKIKNSFRGIEHLFTGKSSERNDAAFQTLLYSLVASDSLNTSDLIPGLYFVRNMHGPNYKSELLIGERKKSPLSNFNTVQQEFKERFIEILTEIFGSNGTFNQTEDEKTCLYCPYKNLCSK